MICPKCKAKMVSSVEGGTATYRCPDCGYEETGWSPIKVGQ